MTWETIPSDAGVFVVWDPYISGPYSCEWDGVFTDWDAAATDWDSGATVWGDNKTIWR